MAMGYFSAIWGTVGYYYGGSRKWKTANRILAAAAIAAILCATLFIRVPYPRGVSLRLFQSFVDAKERPEIYRTVLLNIVLFFPLGLSLPELFPDRWYRLFRIGAAVLIGFSLSVVIEAIQYRFSMGHCEVDDVLTNTVGTLLGAWVPEISRMLRAIRKPWTDERRDNK